jgi:Domain of unknown function (DUF4424)
MPDLPAPDRLLTTDPPNPPGELIVRVLASLCLLALTQTTAFADPIDDDPSLERPDFHYVTASLIVPENDALVIEEQELVIGPFEIRGAYVIRNTSDHEVVGDAVLPLPPFGLHSMWSGIGEGIYPSSVADHVALFDASVTADGVEVPLTTEELAVIVPGGAYATDPGLRFALHEPGKVVTDQLRAFGLPFTNNRFDAEEALLALTPAEQEEVKALGLAAISERVTTDGAEPWASPNWEVMGRLRWTQSFPPGKAVRITYRHRNFAKAWHHDDCAVARWASDYCIDPQTSEAMVAAMTFQMDGQTFTLGDAYQMTHVWQTNPASGPAGRFRLRVNPGVPGGVAATCAGGLERSTTTAFEWEGEDFTPSVELKLLIVAPLPEEW